jgi:endoglucanase
MIATDWARAHAVKLALTEVGMPLDDPRWEAMFINAINHASAAGYEVFSWMGGCHWPSHSFPINHVPEFYQDRTLEPAVSGPMKAAFVVPLGSLFDESTSFSSGGAPVPVTVSSRGHLPAAIQLNVTSNNGGAFSKTTLTIPAGPNGQDTFTFTPAADSVTTLTYSGNGPPGGVLPPPRRIFSLSNPVASASSNLADAALAILARYGAAKWDLADAYTDYLQGVPAHAGDPVRAVADSGFASSVGNAMNMLNWVNKAQDGMGPMQVPMLRVTNGFKSSDHSAGNTWGLWCKKSVPVAGIQPRPRDRVLYNLEDPHFVMAVIAVPSASNNGVIFQASRSSELFTSELGVSNSIPTATWIDAGGQQVQLRSAVALTVSTPSVLSMTCAPGAQALRVNGAAAGTSAATLAPGLCDQMLMGWGFLSYYPRESFAGSIYAVIAGKGAPAADELAVLEKYLGSLAGVAI